MTSFNTEQNIRDRLSFLNGLDQYSLANRLEDANLEVQTLVGNVVEEELRADRREQTEYTLSFNSVHKVLRVDWRDEQISEEDYEVVENPHEPVKIIFDEETAKDFQTSRWRPVIEYIPQQFKTLELKLACKDIVLDSSTQLQDDELKSQTEQYEKSIQRLVKAINQSTVNLGSKDRGKTVASNYNFRGSKHRRYG